MGEVLPHCEGLPGVWGNKEHSKRKYWNPRGRTQKGFGGTGNMVNIRNIRISDSVGLRGTQNTVNGY